MTKTLMSLMGVYKSLMWWVKSEMELQAKHLGDQYCMKHQYYNVMYSNVVIILLDQCVEFSSSVLEDFKLEQVQQRKSRVATEERPCFTRGDEGDHLHMAAVDQPAPKWDAICLAQCVLSILTHILGSGEALVQQPHGWMISRAQPRTGF